jgi:hypothetical protein
MKSTDEDYEKYYDQARLLQHQYRDYENLRDILIKKGASDLIAAEIITQLKKINHANNRTTGTQILLFSCLMLLIGFILTCVCFYTNTSINLVMYGFTTVGLIGIFIGLYYIFK